MSETEKKKPKPSVAANPQPDRIVQALAEAEEAATKFGQKFDSMAREARMHRESMEVAQEERRRLAEHWDYEENQRRRAVKDAQADEDRERERKHAERLALVEMREKTLKEAAKELFSIDASSIDRDGTKSILEAFAKKIADAENRGKTSAEAAAKKDYETAKKLDDAATNSKISLLQAENERLKADNTAANARAERIQSQYDTLAQRMGDLPREAFAAAGGITAKANDALTTAAQGQGAQRRS